MNERRVVEQLEALPAAPIDAADGSACRETSEGFGLPPASVRRLACQGRVTPIIIGVDGTALDAGRTIRHANRRQRRALRAMYRSCAFGECDELFDRCETHHLLPWESGGATDLRNLVPLCSRHHHTVHEFGWSLELSPDRPATGRSGRRHRRTRRPTPAIADPNPTTSRCLMRAALTSPTKSMATTTTGPGRIRHAHHHCVRSPS